MSESSSWLRRFFKSKQKAKEPEESLLAGIPPDWAGPLTIICISFVSFFLCWLIIAKRPTSQRLLSKHKLEVVIHTRPVGFWDPVSGQSHRLFKSELGARAVSIIHAAISVYGSWRSLQSDKELSPNALWHVSTIALFYFSISIAYYIGTVIVCVVLFRSYGFRSLMHGIASLVALSICVFGKRFHYFGCIGLLWESSTIFLNIRWYLREYGYRSRWLSMIADCLLAVVFGVARIAIGIPELYLLWSQLSAAVGERDLSKGHFFICSALILTLTVINVVWFKQMLQNVGGHIFQSSRSAKSRLSEDLTRRSGGKPRADVFFH